MRGRHSAQPPGPVSPARSRPMADLGAGAGEQAFNRAQRRRNADIHQRREASDTGGAGRQKRARLRNPGPTLMQPDAAA